MRRVTQFAIVVATFAVGCNRSAPTAPTDAIPVYAIRVPNMTCGTCAAEIRDKLAAIPGVSEVSTDCAMRKISFRLADETLDLAAKLDELAQTNEYLVDWSWF